MIFKKGDADGREEEDCHYDNGADGVPLVLPVLLIIFVASFIFVNAHIFQFKSRPGLPPVFISSFTRPYFMSELCPFLV